MGEEDIALSSPLHETIASYGARFVVYDIRAWSFETIAQTPTEESEATINR